jgi:hypothetical protein
MFADKRIDLLLAAILVASAFAIPATASGGGLQQDKKERRLKAKDFKDVPLVVTAVRNLDSDTWHKDLEIEVKNVSNKPIYFVLAYLSFPDVPVSNGVFGIALEFGTRRNIDYRNTAAPEDPHINSGDKFVFTIPENMRKGLRVEHEKSPERMQSLDIHFSVISFGDGTGFVAERLRDRRLNKAKAPDGPKHLNANRPGKSATAELNRYLSVCGSASSTLKRLDDQRLSND